MARTVSSWVRTSTRAQDVGGDAAAAVQAANAFPGQVATLILPSDASWNEGGAVAEALPAIGPAPLDPHAVDNAARVLRGGKNALILLAGRGVLGASQALAWRVAQACGADIRADYVTAHVARGRGTLQLERVPYGTDQAIAALARYDHIILVCAKPPVGFFAYPGKPSTQYPAHAQLHVLARPDQDPEAALAGAGGKPGRARSPPARPRPAARGRQRRAHPRGAGPDAGGADARTGHRLGREHFLRPGLLPPHPRGSHA